MHTYQTIECSTSGSILKTIPPGRFTPTKQSNAQHLVEYKKQLLYEENQKSGNVMQQPQVGITTKVLQYFYRA